MNVLVVTSSRLKSIYNRMSDVYYEFFEVNRVANHGLLEIFHPVYAVSLKDGYFYNKYKKVELDEGFEDLELFYRETKTYETLEKLNKDHTVYVVGDAEFNYSKLIMWQIHKQFKIPLDRFFLTKKETIGGFMRSKIGGLYKPFRFMPLNSFDETEIRTLMGLMVFKDQVKQYSAQNIYGAPLNSASFLFIKLVNEMNIEGLRKRDILDTLKEEIKKIDITLYNPTFKPGIMSFTIAKRLYRWIDEDLEGFSDKTFIPKINQTIHDFATHLIPYPVFVEAIKKIFTKKGEPV